MDLLEQIKPLLNNQFLTGGFILGLIGAIFYPLKSLPVTIWNKLKFYLSYTVYLDQNDEIYFTFSEWFREKYPNKFRNIEIRFSKDNSYDSRNENKIRWKILKFQYIDSNFIWYKRRLLWIHKNRKELESARDIINRFHNSYKISGLFSKSAIDNLCQELQEFKIKKEGGNSISIFSHNKWSEPQKMKSIVIKDFKNIFFKNKELYLKDINNFIQSKDFYKEKGINYKRSYLLYGPPGTGKSSLGSATAKYLDYDLYVININALENDNDLIQFVSRIPSESVILFEDIDCFLNNRDIKTDKLNFSTLLNVLDGVYSPSDCIFIMTSNKKEELDTALLRKGRVDLLLHLDYPDVECIKDFINNFYNSNITLPNGKIEIPMSAIQDICINNSLNKTIEEVTNIINGKKII